MEKYQLNYNLLPNNKKLAIGSVLIRSGIFKKESEMRKYLESGKVRVDGKKYTRAGQLFKVDRNNIKIKIKDKGGIIIKLEDGEGIES